MSPVRVGQARSSADHDVLSQQRTLPRTSQCRLSADAQVKAALWIPLGVRGGLLHSAGSGPLSEWLPEDLVLDWTPEGL